MSAISYQNSILVNLPEERQSLVNLWLMTQNSQPHLAEQLHGDLYPNSTNRYRCSQGEKADIVKAVFDLSFKRAPEKVIQASEEVAGRSFYPLWKRCYRIYLPRVIGSVLGNVCVKVMIVVLVGLLGIGAGVIGYELTHAFVSQTVIPFVLNNTPLIVMDLFQAAVDRFIWVYKNSVPIILGIWVTKQIVLSIDHEIPVLSPALRALDLWKLAMIAWSAPQTIGGFIFYQLYDAAKFGWDGCDDLSQFFLQIAHNAESERYQESKHEAYLVWKSQIS
jgi:hypothetical protein